MPSLPSSAIARRVSLMATASGCRTKVKIVAAGSRITAMVRSYLCLASWIAAAGPMQVWPLPWLAASMDWLHSAGSSSRRRVWPVGAVSKITTSKVLPSAAGTSRKSVKRSKEATSAVQGPLICSSITCTICGGKAARRGAMARSMYSWVAWSGSISMAHRLGTPAMGVTWWPISCSNTSARLEAGIGGDDQRALAFVGVAHGVRAGHAGLAHAALAGEEDKLGGHEAAPFRCGRNSARVG